MSVQEIKAQLATLSQKDQDEVVAYLFHLRHSRDSDLHSDVDRRMGDSEPSHWLSPDEFERKLNAKEMR